MKVLAIISLILFTFGTLNGLVDLNNKDAFMNRLKRRLNSKITSSRFGDTKIARWSIEKRFFFTVIAIILGLILGIISISLS